MDSIKRYFTVSLLCSILVFLVVFFSTVAVSITAFPESEGHLLFRIMIQSLLLSILAHISLSVYIMKPLRTLKTMVDNVADGSFEGNSLKRNNNDEIGRLIHSFSKLSDLYLMQSAAVKSALGNVDRICCESEQLMEAVMDGRLSHRMNTVGINESYKEIGEHINDVLDSFVRILDHIPIPILIIGMDHELKFQNKQVSIPDGGSFDGAEYIESRCADLWECDSDLCQFNDCKETEQCQSFEKNGKTDYLISLIPYKDKSDKMRAILETSIDITQQKKSERKVIKLIDLYKKYTDRLIEAIEKLEQEDLNYSFDDSDWDEDTREMVSHFRDLLRSIENIKANFDETITEVERVKDSVTDGSLFTRCNSELFKGYHKEIIDNMNEILDSFVNILDSIRMPLLFMGTDYKLRFLNIWTGAKDVDREPLVGKRCYDIYPCEMDKCMFKECRDEDQMQTFEENVSGTDFAIYLMPYKDKNGTTRAVFETAFITTEQKKLETLALKQLAYQKNNIDILIKNISNFERGNLDISSESLEWDEDTKEIAVDFIRLNESLRQGTDIIKLYIEEISGILSRVARKDFSVSIEKEYLGNFADLKDSINYIIDQFNSVISEISIAAIRVNEAAQQVSISSRTLSQGASEQASSVEEISATISDVAEQTRQNSTNANKANELSLKAKTDAQNGKVEMGSMLDAMEEINESSKNISQIVKVIDDIAFQTNILALNAAVEAARAGQHGKGFAVVAEEVRSLAARSAEAAKETTDMIESSIHKVEEGYAIANKTAEALNMIVARVTDAVEIVGNISEASIRQATSITQIDAGVNQIAQVTQSNTNTAEESTLTSEEMAEQALLLKTLINEFKLKSDLDSDRDCSIKISENQLLKF